MGETVQARRYTQDIPMIVDAGGKSLTFYRAPFDARTVREQFEEAIGAIVEEAVARAVEEDRRARGERWTCSTCHGVGHVTYHGMTIAGGFVSHVPCPQCGAAGFVVVDGAGEDARRARGGGAVGEAAGEDAPADTMARQALTLEEARQKKVCRLCLKPTRLLAVGESLILDGGKEYAHASCLAAQRAKAGDDDDFRADMDDDYEDVKLTRTSCSYCGGEAGVSEGELAPNSACPVCRGTGREIAPRHTATKVEITFPSTLFAALAEELRDPAKVRAIAQAWAMRMMSGDLPAIARAIDELRDDSELPAVTDDDGEPD